MDLARILKQFDGIEVDLSALGAYEKWALSFFHDAAKAPNPELTFTLQLDITKAMATYKKHYELSKDASFSAFLIWKLVQTLRGHECFNYRLIEGKWYLLRNPPVFIPVATGKKDRFREVFFENVAHLPWKDFSKIYRKEVKAALSGKAHEAGIKETETIFLMSLKVGNLPNIQFTSLTLH